MYVAMNRFKVRAGSEAEFETIWKNRDSKLNEMEGFKTFHLLRGAENKEEGYTLYASHTIWESEDAFRAWTRSEHFRSSHRNTGETKPAYIGHPQFEGFTPVEGA